MHFLFSFEKQYQNVERGGNTRTPMTIRMKCHAYEVQQLVFAIYELETRRPSFQMSSSYTVQWLIRRVLEPYEKHSASTALTTWKSFHWCSSRLTQTGKSDSFVYWIPFDLISASSLSISLGLTSFDFTCMVIDQFPRITFHVSHFKFLDLTNVNSACIVIDQYLHVLFLFYFCFLSRSRQFWFEMHCDRSIPSSSISHFSIRIPRSHLFCVHLHCDLSIPSRSISFYISRFFYLDLINFDSNYMVIDQYFHCLSLASHLKFLRHAQFASTYIVIDQYLHAPSFSSHVWCLDLTNFDSTCLSFNISWLTFLIRLVAVSTRWSSTICSP